MAISVTAIRSNGTWQAQLPPLSWKLDRNVFRSARLVTRTSRSSSGVTRHWAVTHEMWTSVKSPVVIMVSWFHHCTRTISLPLFTLYLSPYLSLSGCHHIFNNPIRNKRSWQTVTPSLSLSLPPSLSLSVSLLTFMLSRFSFCAICQLKSEDALLGRQASFEYDPRHSRILHTTLLPALARKVAAPLTLFCEVALTHTPSKISDSPLVDICHFFSCCAVTRESFPESTGKKYCVRCNKRNYSV